MKKITIITGLLLLASFGLFAKTTGKGKWKIKKNYTYKGVASVHVSGPEDFTFSVKARNIDKEEDIPGIVKLYGVNAYAKVTIKAPNGDTWSKRLEIKSRKELKIEFSYTAAKKIVKKKIALVKGYFYNSYAKCRKAATKYTQLVTYVFTKRNAKGYYKKYVVDYRKPRLYRKLKPGTYWIMYNYKAWNGYKKRWSVPLNTSGGRKRYKLVVRKNKAWSHGFGCGRI